MKASAPPSLLASLARRLALSQPAARPLGRPATAARGWSMSGGWRPVGLGLIVAVALGLRLVGIANNSDLSDEGIRGIQLRLMQAGYRPVAEIYASQGPLSLPIFYPLYLLFGADIVAARLAVVVYSMIAIGASVWLARRWIGWPAALAAAALLAVSPVVVESSRRAFVEVPSLAPALVGLALLTRFSTSGGWGWLVGSAILLAVGALVKPMAATAAAAVPFLLLARPVALRSRLTDLVAFGLVGVAVVVAVVLVTGPREVLEQIVAYRLGAREARGWDLTANLALVGGELGRDGVGLGLLAAVGGLQLAWSRPRVGLALLTWLLGTLALLLAYSPLWPKHVVYALPPLAMLGAAGVQMVVVAVQDAFARRGRPGPLAVVGAVALSVYLVGLPKIVAQDRQLVEREVVADAQRYADDLRLVGAVTTRDDVIVMDDAYLAMTTGRLVPPYLADLSWNRILARALSADRAIAETERANARVVVIQDDHLGRLQRFTTWADRSLVLVKSYVQRRPNRFRRVYVAPGVDLAAARAALAASIEARYRADFGTVAVHGHTLERRDLKNGNRYALTVHWESLVTRPPEHHAVIRLRRADGSPALESSWKIGDGSQELRAWAAGQWQFQTVRFAVEDVQPGSYRLTLGLDRPNGGAAPITASDGVQTASTSELDLGEVTVR